MEVTKSQLNYIWTINQLSGSKTAQKDICEYLDVKKSSASVALKSLEENQYISKINVNGENRYILDKKGRKIIEEIEKERFEFMSVFRDLIGMDSYLCEEEYNTVYGCFSKKFINKLAQLHKNNYNNSICKNNTVKLHIFENGVYELPFEVIQHYDGKYVTVPSMGDKGLEHPAFLIVDNSRADILLKAKEIQYVSKKGNRLKGKLNELYYVDNVTEWINCQKESEDIWIIPFSKILYQKDETGKISIGAVKIKAIATTIKMPESTAEITFNFKLLKKINCNNSQNF